MLTDLPPGFEAAAHTGDIFESVFQKVSDGSQTPVTVITVHDHLAILVRMNSLRTLWAEIFTTRGDIFHSD